MYFVKLYGKMNKKYIKEYIQKWCDEHPETNVVRFTTFLYQFSLIFNDKGKEKYVDWFGYTLASSPALLDAFEKEYGYALTAEDLVDGGGRRPGIFATIWSDGGKDASVAAGDGRGGDRGPLP